MATCSVPHCKNSAFYEVFTYQFCLDTGGVVFEPDTECQFICSAHAIINEKHAEGNPEYKVMGSGKRYPYTKKLHVDGFTVYIPIDHKDFYRGIPKEVEQEAIKKVSDYCKEMSENVSDLERTYTCRIYRNTITIMVTQPRDDEVKGQERITIPLARLRYEKRGEPRLSQLELEEIFEPVPSTAWHQFASEKREWMLYWHRYTNEWIKVADLPTHPDINYWLRYMEEDESGVFYG